MKLIEGFDSNYRYILVAARRARQLQSGAPPVVQTNSRKPCRIAQDEIRAGKVKWEIPETRSAAEQAAEVLDRPSATMLKGSVDALLRYVLTAFGVPMRQNQSPLI